MRALVVYESMYGNTHAVATDIAAGLRSTHDVTLVPVTRATPELVASADLIVAGGPTHMHGMSTVTSRRIAAETASKPGSGLAMDADADGPGLHTWLERLNARDVLAVCFDTRRNGPPAFTGRASRSISRLMTRSGCRLMLPAESFLVTDRNTLLEGETARACSWGALVGEAACAAYGSHKRLRLVAPSLFRQLISRGTKSRVSGSEASLPQRPRPDRLKGSGQVEVEVSVMTVNQVHNATSGTGEGDWRWPVPHDPGDLSRRLSSRRAELGFSVSQVARRAGVEPRYLAYLENFPGQPEPATLRKLAAALRTTSSALLGAGHEASSARYRGDACWGSASLVERMQPAECYRKLAPRGIGRIAFATASGLMLLPVSYVATDRTIVIRTGSDSMLALHGDGPVSFEADHFDLETGQGWSVLVRGEARRVLEPQELRHLREDCDLRPWPAGEQDLFARIVPDQVTGHRIRS